MSRCIIIVLLFLLSEFAFAQQGPNNRGSAEYNIVILRKGTLVVRLKTNEKSIAAYRHAGKEKLAHRLELENRIMNLNLMRSFLLNFNFCKVLFIRAKDTEKLLNHERNIFLNEKLEIDSSVTFKYDSFFIAEYGTLMTNMKADNYKYELNRTKETNVPTSTTAIVILDTSLSQLREPFPFFSTLSYPTYTAPGTKKTVYDKAVERLNFKLEDFMQKVWYRNPAIMKGMKEMWAENNPNKNIVLRAPSVTTEIINAVDELEKLQK